ncbi:MAG: hypothetical protein JKY02_00550, partial [Flavobacteriaceae bacterium]|nr:hypothetical protein [Flavobacteriaceae bacterium]
NIAIYPLRSTHELINPGNLYSKDSDNATPPFYGTEAVLFSNSALPVVKASSINLKTNRPDMINTEIIDMLKIDSNEIFIGYVYGGIEAFRSNPGTYGKTYSRASNVIFKVTLKKK